MDTDDLTWRWPAAQLDVLARISRPGDSDEEATDGVEALENRMRIALQATQLVDDLVNRLMLALLDAGAAPADVAEVMGLASRQAVHRRAKRARRRLRAADLARTHGVGSGQPGPDR